MASVVLSIENSHPLVAPRLVELRARIGNEEQSCAEGYTGDPVPAGKYFMRTLATANALAAADLDCIPNGD